MPDSTIPVPVIKQGLTIDPAAKMQGSLEYTQNSELQFPSGVVQGKITRLLQPVEGEAYVEPTTGEKASQWGLQSLRSLVTLILLGLLLLWLVPGFLRKLTAHLEAKPLQSLGWGVVAYAGFFFLLMLTVFVAILAAVVFGLLTLSSLSATIVWLGILALFALILGFVLVTSFLAKIVFGMTIRQVDPRQGELAAGDAQVLADGDRCCLHGDCDRALQLPADPRLPGRTARFCDRATGAGDVVVLDPSDPL